MGKRKPPSRSPSLSSVGPMDLPEDQEQIVDWEEGYWLLLSFRKRHNSLEVPFDNRQYRDLYYWILEQRQRYKKRSLPKEEKRRLDNAGFQWEAPKSPSTTLVSTTAVTSTAVTPNATNRSKKKKIKQEENFDGEHSGKVLQLQHYQPSPVPVTPREKADHRKWHKGYDLYKAFREKNGPNGRITSSRHRFLYFWVQRQRYLQLENKLQQDRFEALDELGFSWSKPDQSVRNHNNHDEYDDMENGSMNDNSTEEQEEGSLQEEEEEEEFDEALEKKRVRQLLARKEPSLHHAKIWVESYRALRKYKKKFGHTHVTFTQREYRSLYNWIYRQRRLGWEGTISDDRRELLDALKFPWNEEGENNKGDGSDGNSNNSRDEADEQSDAGSEEGAEEDESDGEEDVLKKGGEANPQDIQWMARYKSLKSYSKKFGTCKVRCRKGDKFESLYYWANTQKKKYEKGDISDERKALLEKIGFGKDEEDVEEEEEEEEEEEKEEEESEEEAPTPALPSPRGKPPVKSPTSKSDMWMAQWMESYDNLLKFKKKYGHVDVKYGVGAAHDMPLYKWVWRQRKLYQKGDLTAKKIELMNDIGFSWE